MPKVLLVDDEEAIRFALSELMGLHGIEVRTAASADEALPQIEGADVLVTDYAITGRSGLELLDQVRAADPSIPVYDRLKKYDLPPEPSRAE